MFGMKNAEGIFPSLPARNERGERWREGKLMNNGIVSALRRHGRGVGWVVTMMPGRSDSRAVLKSGLFLAKSSTSLRASTARPVRRRRSERPLTDSMFRGHISMDGPVTQVDL